MKDMKRELLVVMVLLVVFPLIYLVYSMVNSPDQEIQEQPEGFHCTLLSQRMDSDTLVVEMQNSGAVTWSEDDMVRCLIYLDGADGKMRAALQPGQTVSTGESATFRFENVKGWIDETAHVGMVWELVEYAPERYQVKMDPLPDLHCELVEQYMDADTLIITLRNTGESVWQEKDWVRCAIFLDGQDSGLRAKLHPGQSIGPGEEAEFSFPCVRLLLNETVQIVMLQETVTYFTERFQVEIF